MIEDRNGRHPFNKSSFSPYGRQQLVANQTYNASSNFQPLLMIPMRGKSTRHSRSSEPLLQPPVFNKTLPLRRRPQPPSSNGNNGFVAHHQQRLLRPPSPSPQLTQPSSSLPSSSSTTQPPTKHHQSSFTSGEMFHQTLPLNFLFNGSAGNSMTQQQLQQLQHQQMLMNNTLNIGTVGSEILNQSHSSSSSLNNSNNGCNFSNNKNNNDNESSKEDRRQSGLKQNVNCHEQRYKTELCRAYEEQKNCVYGDRCMFAHGHWELKKSVHRHPKYKTQKCVAFEKHGLCQFGPRCAFLHEKPFTLEQVLDQVQKLKREPMPENPLPTAPLSSASVSSSATSSSAVSNEQSKPSLLSCETFGVPLLCGSGKVMDKSDLLPDLSSLLLDEQANTAAILFSESSAVPSRRLPVFEQLCSSYPSGFDYDLILLDGSSLSTLAGSSWLDNSSFSNLGSTIISTTSLSCNNSSSNSFDASINSISIGSA